MLSKHYGELAQLLHEKAMDGQLERLAPDACIDAYAVPLQPSRRNVVLITQDVRRTADVFDVFHAFVPTEKPEASGEQYSWICDDKLGASDQCLYHLPTIKANTANWTVSDSARVQYCLSEKTQEHCKMNVSLNMSVICIIVIFLKVILMFAVAIHVDETILMTTGDAIESFMKDPDPYTQGMCMATKKMIDTSPNRWPQTPVFVTLEKFRWSHSIKTRIAAFCLL